MVIFGAGVVTGGMLVHQAQTRNLPHREGAGAPARGPQIISAGGVRLEFLRRMQRELDLNQDQRHEIDRILKESQERNKELMEPVTPRLREELRRVKMEFREVLTPAQRSRFDELLIKQGRGGKKQESRSEKS